MTKPIDANLLRQLIPAGTLKADNFQELAHKTMVEELGAGTVIFKQGERDNKAVYLLEGEVHLSDGKDSRVIKGGSKSSKHPFANRQPRPCTAKAKTKCKITRVDTNLLDILMTWDQLSGIEVGAIDTAPENGKEGEKTDWMSRILSSRLFAHVPPANIQALFMRVKEKPVKAGSVIIEQGAAGDNYYIIKEGKCKVTRRTRKGEVVLAHLSDGDSFGEEALLSDTKRNANVVMTTDGSLASLSRDDFNELLKEPVLHWISVKEGTDMVQKGEASWVDVRLPSEHKEKTIPGSINIPLFMLRLKATSLDAKKKYILYCDTGKRSSAGAFILGEFGLESYCLKGGLLEYGK